MEEKNRSNVEVFDRFGEMKRLLEENDLPCRDDELADYLQMFDVISELIQGQLDTEAMVGCFAALATVRTSTGSWRPRLCRLSRSR